MIQVETEKANRLLKVTYREHVDAGETKKALNDLPALVAEFKSGFRLLTDLSSLDSMELACVPHLRKMMDLLNQGGVELVVRVIPDPHKDIGLNIMSLFHYRRGVRIVTCESLTEALTSLSLGAVSSG